MSFSPLPNDDNIDISLLNNGIDNFELQKINDYPLDESFSLICSKESQLKNSLEFSDIQFLNNSNNKNIEGDKECSPAPAPLRSSPNQNENQKDLSNSHNMECPEVVNKNLNNNNIELDEKMIEMSKLYNYEYTISDDELIEKPFDENRYFKEIDLTQSLNIIDSNNIELENKSAAVNVIPINDNLNSHLNKINSLNNVNNSNISQNLSSSVQELSCPKNIFIVTPLCSKNNKNIENVLFINTNQQKKNKNKNGFVRKLKPDSIRKKIKARFHKKLKLIINDKLKECRSKYFFDLLPQSFVTNINIDFNKPLLNITMRELFQKTFGFKAKDREKINHNKRVLKYLEDNPHINNNDKISNFLDSTYEEIIQKYMHGKYLLEDIERLKKQRENSDYINRYTFIAIHWIDFYKNGHI